MASARLCAAAVDHHVADVGSVNPVVRGALVFAPWLAQDVGQHPRGGRSIFAPVPLVLEKIMTTQFLVGGIAALVLCLCGCGEEKKSAPANALEEAKEGMSKIGDAFSDAWATTVQELGGKTDEIKARIEAAKPEVRAKLTELKATFEEKLAVARQKVADANAAAPEKIDAMKQAARQAVEEAKQAYRNATEN